MLTHLLRHIKILSKLLLAITFSGGYLPSAALAQCDLAKPTDPSIMLLALTACQKNAPWLARLGHQLNSLGRYQEAADHLERALMLEPELKEAQWDYAVALAGLGDTPSAMALVHTILAQPDLPDHLRPVFQQQLDQWLAIESDPKVWQRRGIASVGVGYDTNLLGSPNLSELTLTFAGQTPQTLPLDDNYRPQEGGYARADAQINWSHTPASGARWEVSTGLHSRSTPNMPQASSNQYDLFIERSTHQSSQSAPAAVDGHYTPGYYLSALVSGRQTRTGTNYQTAGFAAGWARQFAAASGKTCQARIGLEWQERSYLNTPLFSGIYNGAALVWTCSQTHGTQWQISAKLGVDNPRDAERVGGQQRQYTLRLLGRIPLSSLTSTAQSTLVTDIEIANSQDSESYSLLLEDGRIRKTSRSTAHLEYQQPLGKGTQWVVGAEWVSQQSSLSLFNMQSWGPYMALRKAF
jgi:hypothetical protein